MVFALIKNGRLCLSEVDAATLNHNCFICHLISMRQFLACTSSSLKRESYDDLDHADAAGSKKKKPLTDERREERNMREKERSLKITQQIHELRTLLSAGGVIVPKVCVWNCAEKTVFMCFWLRLMNVTNTKTSSFFHFHFYRVQRAPFSRRLQITLGCYNSSSTVQNWTNSN